MNGLQVHTFRQRHQPYTSCVHHFKLHLGNLDGSPGDFHSRKGALILPRRVLHYMPLVN